MTNTAVIHEKPEAGSKPQPTVKDVGKPELGESDVLIRMRLMPVNPSDVASAGGFYPAFNRNKTYPAVLGLEGMGAIEEVGSKVTQFKIGQRITSLSWGAEEGNGTWQTYKVLSESKVIPVPDSVSDEAAAQFVVNPFTAVGFLRTLQIPAGKWLIQSAATSELGRMMITLCKHKGIKTINLVRRNDAKQEILDAGGDVAISTSEEPDFAAKVKEVTGGEMAYAAIDPVAGDMTAKIAASLKPGGTVLVYGALGGVEINGIQLRDLLFRGVVVTGFWLARFLPSLSKEEFPQLVKEVMGLFADGVFQPRAGKLFPLEEVKEAIAASQESARSGKVMLKA